MTQSNQSNRPCALICLVTALFFMGEAASTQSVFTFRQGLDSGSGPYSGGRDTYIDEAFPNDNFGTSTSMWSDNSPWTWQMIASFDDIVGPGAGQVAPGSYVAFARLSVRTWSGSGGSFNSHTVRWMNQPWDEATITYANSPGGNGFQPAETAGVATSLSALNSGAFYSFDFTSTVRAWVDGLPNEGFVVTTTGSDALSFYTSDEPTEAWRPTLTIWTLPQGEYSFADTVVDFTPGAGPITNPDPAGALGDPSGTSVSIGWGGSLTLEFTNNTLRGSGDATADLWIYEVGPSDEGCSVEVSADGVSWISVGVAGGGIVGLDIDSAGLGPNDALQFVRLIDDNLNNQSPYAGADIVAVAAVGDSPWTDLGGGTPGIQGVPQLDFDGLIEVGQTFSLELSQAPPSGLALLWYSVALSTPISVLGGTLYTLPNHSQIALVTSPTGTVSLTSVPWPPGIPSDIGLWFQVICQDLSVASQITLSDAVKLTTP